MPRAFFSGAASIWAYALASPPNSLLSTVVIAAVSVVFPWSTWPIVPTFTCGLVLSNLGLDILRILRFHHHSGRLPSPIAAAFLNDFLSDVPRYFCVVTGLKIKRGAALA